MLKKISLWLVICTGSALIYAVTDAELLELQRIAELERIIVADSVLNAELEAAINPIDAYGTTKLMRAVRNNNWLEVKRLLEAGANPNKSDRDGLLPIMKAVKEGQEVVLQLLLDHGADPRIDKSAGAPQKPGKERKHIGKNGLAYARKAGNRKALEMMLEKVAELEAAGR